jgi:hypothetical protein
MGPVTRGGFPVPFLLALSRLIDRISDRIGKPSIG